MARRRSRISLYDVKEMITKAGVKWNQDYHVLSPADVEIVRSAARLYGYRKSKNAPGSTARMFWQYIHRAV